MKGNTNCTIDSPVTVVLNMQSAFLNPFFMNVLLLPLSKFKCQFVRLPKDWLGKSKEIILVSEFLILVQICWFMGPCDSLLLGLGQNEQKHLTVRTGEVSRGRVCDCGCWCKWHVTGGMQHVTHETCLWHLTWYTWHVKLDFFWIFFFGYFGYCATICTHWEFQCLLYAGYFF